MPKVSKEIVVVDDCSKDGTREWLKAEVVRSLRLRADDFGIEVEMSAQIARQRTLRI
jgi:glycosyltransferase involved in cell wall biosynthesis